MQYVRMYIVFRKVSVEGFCGRFSRKAHFKIDRFGRFWRGRLRGRFFGKVPRKVFSEGSTKRIREVPQWAPGIPQRAPGVPKKGSMEGLLGRFFGRFLRKASTIYSDVKYSNRIASRQAERRPS